jgi:hypothetical protein
MDPAVTGGSSFDYQSKWLGGGGGVLSIFPSQHEFLSCSQAWGVGCQSIVEVRYRDEFH